MNYEDIKTHSERCQYDHLMTLSRLHDEIAELRDYIEAQPQPRQPLSDEEIDKVLSMSCESMPTYTAIAFARYVERAHGIGGRE
jgi:hypothetical protein